MFIEFAAVGVGGFIGACARFFLTKLLPGGFPAATLCANVFAGAAIGVVMGLDSAAPLPPRAKLFINTGILGGLSTFSTFASETVSLFNEGKYTLAVLNILLNLGLSLAGVAAGMAAVKII